MNIFDRFFRLFESRTPVVREASAVPAPAVTVGGVSVYSPSAYDSGQSVAAVYACVHVIAISVATLSLRYLIRRGGLYVDDEHSLYHKMLKCGPCERLTTYQFLKQAVEQLLLRGNAYIFPRYVGGEVCELVLLAPGRVMYDSINDSYHIFDDYNGVYGDYPSSRVLHLYDASTGLYEGKSVLGFAATTVGIAQSGDQETLNRFAGGGTVRGLVTRAGDKSSFAMGVDKGQRRDVAADLNERLNVRRENISALAEDVDFKQISMSSADMQFLESRKFTVLEICRFFGVPPTYVFADTSNNYKSVEQASTDFMSKTLNPILTMIEGEFNKKLVGREGCCKYKFEFDRKGVYAMDLVSRADYQKKTIETGVYSVNDWRRAENQPLVDGGDTVWISTNLQSLANPKVQGAQANETANTTNNEKQE